MLSITLDTVDRVKKFANTTLKCEGAVTAKSQANGIQYVVDGKSLLGLFSLDLSKAINVEFELQNDEQLVSKAFNL